MQTQTPSSTQTWTIQAALNWTQGYLADKGDINPRLSAAHLLTCATGLERIELYMHFDRPLTSDERSTLREAVKRRAAGEPLQYIAGHAPFRHLDLITKPPILIPRPETELLIDLVLCHPALDAGSSHAAQQTGEMAVGGLQDEPQLLDLCTGTGNIAISLAYEHPTAQLTATDIDPAAVALARQNADKYGLTPRVTVTQDDLATTLLQDAANHGRFDVVVSNPPYIPTAELATLPAEVAAWESPQALDGGAGGLDTFARIATQAATLLKPGGLLACELHETTLHQAQALLGSSWHDTNIHQDLNNRPRFITASKC